MLSTAGNRHPADVVLSWLRLADGPPEGEPAPVYGLFDLDRFVEAQDAGGIFDAALAELRAGRKRGHWMWFVFPQVAGLGRSPTAQHFAVSGLDEARAYLGHPVLGPRLVEAARALLDQPSRDAVAVLGPIDAQKLRSSMTLFHRAASEEPVFGRVLDEFFAGNADDATLDRI